MMANRFCSLCVRKRAMKLSNNNPPGAYFFQPSPEICSPDSTSLSRLFISERCHSLHARTLDDRGGRKEEEEEEEEEARVEGQC
jgi:hypothetical protein